MLLEILNLVTVNFFYDLHHNYVLLEILNLNQ